MSVWGAITVWNHLSFPWQFALLNFHGFLKTIILTCRTLNLYYSFWLLTSPFYDCLFPLICSLHITIPQTSILSPLFLPLKTLHLINLIYFHGLNDLHFENLKIRYSTLYSSPASNILPQLHTEYFCGKLISAPQIQHTQSSTHHCSQQTSFLLLTPPIHLMIKSLPWYLYINHISSLSFILFGYFPCLLNPSLYHDPPGPPKLSIIWYLPPPKLHLSNSVFTCSNSQFSSCNLLSHFIC